MSQKRYVVELTLDERRQLDEVRKTKVCAARKRRRAQILLKVDQGGHGPAWTDKRAAEAFDVQEKTVANIRRDLVTLGLDEAITRREQRTPRRKKVITEPIERELLAIAESEPPEGRSDWTLHLLADRLVELQLVDSVSHETVRRALKKKTSPSTVKRHG